MLGSLNLGAVDHDAVDAVVVVGLVIGVPASAVDALGAGFLAAAGVGAVGAPEAVISPPLFSSTGTSANALDARVALASMCDARRVCPSAAMKSGISRTLCCKALSLFLRTVNSPSCALISISTAIVVTDRIQSS